MALGGRQTKKTLLPSEPEDSAGPSDFISRQPAVGAPEARPAPDAPFRPRRGVGGACEGLSGPGVLKGSRSKHREGNGNPLQYPCLANSMDGGAR